LFEIIFGEQKVSDLKLPLGLVLAMLVQLVGGAFWVSKQAHRIEHLETEVEENSEWIDQLYQENEMLIRFATFTENRWAESYEEFGYTRQWGRKPVEKDNE
jgi:hypothetical protein